jgi:hypothetical protein
LPARHLLVRRVHHAALAGSHRSKGPVDPAPDRVPDPVPVDPAPAATVPVDPVLVDPAPVDPAPVDLVPVARAVPVAPVERVPVDLVPVARAVPVELVPVDLVPVAPVAPVELARVARVAPVELARVARVAPVDLARVVPVELVPVARVARAAPVDPVARTTERSRRGERSIAVMRRWVVPGMRLAASVHPTTAHRVRPEREGSVGMTARLLAPLRVIGTARRQRVVGMAPRLRVAGTAGGTGRSAIYTAHRVTSGRSITTTTRPFHASVRTLAVGASGTSVSGSRCSETTPGWARSNGVERRRRKGEQ